MLSGHMVTPNEDHISQLPLYLSVAMSLISRQRNVNKTVYDLLGVSKGKDMLLTLFLLPVGRNMYVVDTEAAPVGHEVEATY